VHQADLKTHHLAYLPTYRFHCFSGQEGHISMINQDTDGIRTQFYFYWTDKAEIEKYDYLMIDLAGGVSWHSRRGSHRIDLRATSSSSAKRGQLVIEARRPPREWFARVIRYAFSVPASPFVSQVNRATSETMRLQATQEGLLPLKSWIKSALDQITQVSMAEPGLEFVSCRRRRHRPAPTGPDAQHPRLGGNQDAQGGADCSLPEPCKSRRLSRFEQNKNILLTAYSGRGIVSYIGRMAPTAKRLPPRPFRTSLSWPAPTACLARVLPEMEPRCPHARRR
jgi:hypothetical protein